MKQPSKRKRLLRIYIALLDQYLKINACYIAAVDSEGHRIRQLMFQVLHQMRTSIHIAPSPR